MSSSAALEPTRGGWSQPASRQCRSSRRSLGRFKPTADFDWNWPKKIEHDLIERAPGLDFIREGRNLALVGTNGLGQTMHARNIAINHAGTHAQPWVAAAQSALWYID